MVADLVPPLGNGGSIKAGSADASGTHRHPVAVGVPLKRCYLGQERVVPVRSRRCKTAAPLKCDLASLVVIEEFGFHIHIARPCDKGTPRETMGRLISFRGEWNDSLRRQPTTTTPCHAASVPSYRPYDVLIMALGT